MDYLIDELGYDAKHSWEDAICPVETAWQRWGDRIAILGGINMDFLVRNTLEAIHQRAVNLLNMTGSKNYALGSGNSISVFVPIENYLAMIGAAKEINRNKNMLKYVHLSISCSLQAARNSK